MFGFGEAHVVSVVGMWESRRLFEIPKGRWEEREKLGLLFRAFHRPGISITLAYLFVACRFSAVRLKR